MYSKFSKINKDDDLLSDDSTGTEYALSLLEKKHALDQRMIASRAQFAISTESFEKSVKRYDRTLMPVNK